MKIIRPPIRNIYILMVYHSINRWISKN